MADDGAAPDVDAEIAALEAQLASARARKVAALAQDVGAQVECWRALVEMDGANDDIPPPYTEGDMLLAVRLLEEAWRQFLKRRPCVNQREPGKAGRKPLPRAEKGRIQKLAGKFRMRADHQGEAIAWPVRATREEAEADLTAWRSGVDVPPVPPGEEEPRPRRPRGEGAIFPYWSGFRGQLVRNGKKFYTATLPTWDEAEAALVELVAETGPLSAAERREHIACGTCGEDGHNKRTCPGAVPDDEASSFSTSSEEEKEEQSPVAVALPPASGSEAGEGGTSRGIAPPVVADGAGKRQYRCRNCGTPGHFAKTCARRAEPAAARTEGADPDSDPEPAAASVPADTSLVAAHLPLVEKVARRMATRLPAHVPFADLVSAGYEGLMDAAKRFDPARGATFEAFAEWRIKGAILDDLRAKDSLSRDMRRLSNEIKAAEQRLTGALGREPTQDEVARELGVTADDLAAQRQKLSGHTVVGLDDAGPDFLDRVADDGAPDPFESAAAGELRERLTDAIRRLPERQQTVLSLHYLEELTLQEIGDMLGVTESRVCQIKAEALADLRPIVDPEIAPAPEPVTAESVDSIAWLMSQPQVPVDPATLPALSVMPSPPQVDVRAERDARRKAARSWCYKCHAFGHGPRDAVAHPDSGYEGAPSGEEVPGSGGVFKVPGGYRWRVGSKHSGRFPTADEAQADLVAYARKRLGMADVAPAVPPSLDTASPAVASATKPTPAPPPAPRPEGHRPAMERRIEAMREAGDDAAVPALERARRKLRVLDNESRQRSRTIAPTRLSREEQAAAEAIGYPVDVVRPQTREDCASMPRPCPFVSCAHHLYLDVNPESGAIKLNFPHLDVWEMTESCSLDVADRGGATLEDVGQFANITRERVRQLEVRALESLHRRADAFGLAPPDDAPVGYEAAG
jgi:RNA polymerase sigma factor FliA